MKQVRLSTNPDAESLRGLSLGDVVYLDGYIYTAREGVYTYILEGAGDFPEIVSGAANFHCSPAASISDDGTYNLGAVTATASFRFSKWIGDWLRGSNSKLVIGKGGMSESDYRDYFVPFGAVYLTTVGYGTGALLGRGIKRVCDVFFRDELGLAQAMWVFEAQNMGPFMVESDIEGNSLFVRENKKISSNLSKLYEGTKPAVLGRYGETGDRKDEIIG